MSLSVMSARPWPPVIELRFYDEVDSRFPADPVISLAFFSGWCLMFAVVLKLVVMVPVPLPEDSSFPVCCWKLMSLGLIMAAKF